MVNMKPGPATVIVLGMFGSFAVVLAAMIVLTRSGREGKRPVPTISPPEASEQPTRTPVREDAGLAPGAPSTNDRASEAAASAPAAPPAAEPAAPRPVPRRGATSLPPAGRELQRKLEQEQKEVRLLKAEMEKRLRAQVAANKDKLNELARNCAVLPPGEAAQLLAELDDKTIVTVLRRMDRQAALGIAAVLQRLGRHSATGF